MPSLRPAVPDSFCIHHGDCSLNWSGWDVGSGTGNGFSGVQGNWNAECTSGGGHGSTDQFASWVGLGGWYSNDQSLEQTGILLQSDGTYRMWWAYVWPDPSQPSGSSIIIVVDQNDVVTCGQHLTAYIHYGSRNGYCSNGGFRPHIQDTSTGKVLDPGCQSETHGYGIQSAEWVDERPTDTASGCLYQLSAYKWTDWSNMAAQANYSGAGWARPGSFVNSGIVMHDDGLNLDLSYPDQYSIGSNNWFTDRWYAYGTYCDT
jgi:hypothetical protein